MGYPGVMNTVRKIVAWALDTEWAVVASTIAAIILLIPDIATAIKPRPINKAAFGAATGSRTGGTNSGRPASASAGEIGRPFSKLGATAQHIAQQPPQPARLFVFSRETI